MFVTVLAGLALGGYVYYQQALLASAESKGHTTQAATRSIAVEVAPAESRKLARILEAVGTTRALRSIDIVPDAEGRIVEIDIVAGREVEAGQLLARLDDEIEQATLTEAQATLDEKSAALARAETLFQSKTVSRATIDQVRAETAIARATQERAQRRLDDRVVRAPFSGVLGIKAIDLGARVDTDSVLTSLDDLSAVEIEFSLPETVYGQIEEGQAVTAVAAAFPGRSFTGTVVAVDSRIDQTSRAFKLRARLPNEKRELPAGMFMRLSLAMGARDAVIVREEAILVQGGNAYLFIVENGKAVQRRITAGARRDGMVEVVSGIAAGEVVVSRGIQSLRDGIPVDVLVRPPPDGGEDLQPPAGAARQPAPSSGTAGQRSS
ncbi:efflux RND transporter periplasmic adaptor subunit [Denitrobaculum tricleocarpae]|uniref:Efflux RND transporter periplasmic adaptor subunit n=1 Tax=Denitrobaculum tricleocarpae TaxID=2591009 RepID=A0A545U374_9PROT|nr:efflux RND transporter periplasmic adaptor subunit [Denitrobaculum tricleocarpae]